MSKNLTLIVTVVLSLVLASNVSAALVGQWNFDDGTANDSSGAPTIHNGTLQGGALVVTDPTRGQVVSCDGVDDMVKCVGYKAILGTNPRSISAWIKTNKTGSSIQGITAWGSGGTGKSWDFVVVNSKLRQMAYNKDRNSSITVADGNWHHVASVWAGGTNNYNTVKLYVDGVLDTSTSGDGSTAINTTSGTRDFMIGNTDSMSGRFFQGSIDDVRLFDTALTDGDIRLLANKLEAYNLTPANGTLVVSSAVLDWDSIAPSPLYNVYLGTNQSDVTNRVVGTRVGYEQADSTYSASSLTLDTTFYWVVDVVSGGNTYAGPVMTFTTAKPYAYNPLPINDAKFMPRTISLLSWTRSNIMQTQDVYFGTHPAEMELVVEGITEPNIPISELEAGLTYYWRVDTHSDAGVNSLGTWSFRMADSIPDESLVAWWPMESDDSSYIWDHSGYGHHALKNGTPSIITDIQRGNVMNFPGGIGNYFNAGGKGDWASLTNSLTYCAWFKVESFTKNMQCLIGTVGSYRLSRNGTTNTMRLWHDPSPPRGTLGGTSDVNDNQWHHGCGVVDSNGTGIKVYLYVDGELENSASYTGSILPLASDLFIGGDSTSYTDREWKGLADDVRIYNRALSQLEIKRLIGKLGAANFSPADGTDTLTTSVQLDWESIAESPTYNVYFSSNFEDVNNCVPGALVGNGISESSYLASDLATDTTYYWAVDVIDNGITYPSEKILSFTTPKPYAYNPLPIDGGKYPASTSKLSWTVSPLSSGQDVYFGTAPDQMELIAANTTDPNVSVELAGELTYYWRVDTTTSLGVQSQGVWSFTTLNEDQFLGEPNLVGWWKFDDDAGASAWDYSGNNHHGTIVNATHADGKQGQGINLVRADKCYVTIPSAAFSTVNSQVTVALWSFGGNALPVDTSVFNGDEGTGNRILNAHLPWNTGSIIFDAGHTGTTDNYDRMSKGTASANQYKGQWNHWAFTKNTSTGDMKIYLNGMLWATSASKTKPMSGITRFKIGCGANATSNFYDGIVDDFRVYNKELSQEQIWLMLNMDPALDNLRAVVSNWLTAGPTGNLNTDGIVDLRDFEIAARQWGWQD